MGGFVDIALWDALLALHYGLFAGIALWVVLLALHYELLYWHCITSCGATLHDHFLGDYITVCFATGCASLEDLLVLHYGLFF